FHRGISLALVLLAAIVLLAEMLRYRERNDCVALLTFLLPISLAGSRHLVSFRAGQKSRREGLDDIAALEPSDSRRTVRLKGERIHEGAQRADGWPRCQVTNTSHVASASVRGTMTTFGIWRWTDAIEMVAMWFFTFLYLLFADR